VDRLIAPSSDYLFGTDGQGRDVYSRVVEVAQLSLIVGISRSIATSLIGGLLGQLTGSCPVSTHR
jgi:ABC-type dipeptide/oligopeptide/nickel transport system permease subunit